MKYTLIILLALHSLTACKTKKTLPEQASSSTNDTRPSWVQSRPTSGNYYIGIGVSSKKFAANDFAQVAKRNALNDLASEISVKIDANSILYQLETNDRFREDFKQTTKLSTTKNLEGYEVVDSWEDDKDYWIFYRLSKAKYQQEKERAMRQSIDRSMGYYKAGKEFESSGNISEAFRQYFKALESVSSYLGEPLETQVDGGSVFYGNLINKKIESLVSRIEIEPMNSKLFSVTGKKVPRSQLGVKVRSKEDPLSGVPIRFIEPNSKFTVQPEQTVTNEKGNAVAEIERAPGVGTYQIQGLISYKGLIDTKDELIQAYMNTLNDRSAEITLVVESPAILVSAKEVNLGKSQQPSKLGKAFEAGASDYRLQTTDDRSNWDYKCEIDVTTSKNSVMNDLYISVLNGTLKLVDSDGNLVHQHVFSNVKGVGLNYNQAGDKAIEAAMVDIREEIVPDISRKLTL